MSNLTNATGGPATGFNSSFELVPIVVVLVIGAVLLPLFSQTVYEKLHQTAPAVVTSIAYAIKGFITVVGLSILTTPLYLFAQADGQTQTQTIIFAGGALAVFGVLVVIGHVADYGWHLLNKRHKTMTGDTLTERLSPDETEEDTA